MFYIEAPRGILSLKNFELYATVRLKFLFRVIKCRNIEEFLSVLSERNLVADSDVLLEGSHKDIISHYTLRFHCIMFFQPEYFAKVKHNRFKVDHVSVSDFYLPINQMPATFSLKLKSNCSTSGFSV